VVWPQINADHADGKVNPKSGHGFTRITADRKELPH